MAATDDNDMCEDSSKVPAKPRKIRELPPLAQGDVGRANLPLSASALPGEDLGRPESLLRASQEGRRSRDEDCAHQPEDCGGDESCPLSPPSPTGIQVVERCATPSSPHLAASAEHSQRDRACMAPHETPCPPIPRVFGPSEVSRWFAKSGRSLSTSSLPLPSQAACQSAPASVETSLRRLSTRSLPSNIAAREEQLPDCEGRGVLWASRMSMSMSGSHASEGSAESSGSNASARAVPHGSLLPGQRSSAEDHDQDPPLSASFKSEDPREPPETMRRATSETMLRGKTPPALIPLAKRRSKEAAPTNLAVLCTKKQIIPEKRSLLSSATRFVKTLTLVQLKEYRRAYIAWLIIVVIVCSVTFWCICANSNHQVHFLDALYMVVSAITMTGLNTLDLSLVPVPAQVVVWVSILAASPMVMSLVPVASRWLVVRSRKATCHQFGVAFFGLNTTLEDDEMVLKAIMITVAAYWLMSQLISWIIYMICFSTRDDYGPWAWHGLFLATSAFHNAGLVTLPNMQLPFRNDPIAWPVLLTVALQIMGGNTWAPIALRFLVWVQYKVAVWRGSTRRVKVLNMLLRYPRTCYSHLFPDYATRWLLIVQIGFILVQMLVWAIETTSLRHVVAHTTPSEYVLATIFQCITTRTAGFNIVDLSLLPVGVVVMSLVAMWVSNSPVTVLVKSTVRKQHIKGGEEIILDDGARRDKDRASTRDQFGNIMTDGMPLLFFLLMVMLVIEDSNPRNPSSAGTRLMRIVYEFASAYGTVGLSMSSQVWSYSYYWTRYSQAALMAVMMLGRLRGLPDHIDPTLDVSQWYMDDKIGKHVVPEAEMIAIRSRQRQRRSSEPNISASMLFDVVQAGPEDKQVVLPARRNSSFSAFRQVVLPAASKNP